MQLCSKKRTFNPLNGKKVSFPVLVLLRFYRLRLKSTKSGFYGSSKFFLQNFRHKQSVPYQVSPPHSPRFANQSVEPLHSYRDHPCGCPLYSAGIKVKDCTQTGKMGFCTLRTIESRPYLLYWCSHPHKKHVGFHFIHRINHSKVILFRELGFIRR